MENKSNSLNRIKRQQREKVLRFSIRKYSFGAASVAVAALMFLGAHVVSADVVDAKNQPAIGAANPNEEKSPLIEPAPTAKNEETKETEKVEVAKETKEREKTSENKEAVEANPLNNGTSTSTITVTKDASGDKVTEKQTLDKSQLQASITNVQELLDKVNKEKAPASTLAAIQADLERANSVLNNNSLELTQAEIDAIAKKLNEKIFVLSSMPKANAPEKVVKEGKNTIANTGSHDSRNGQSMGKGTNFRANGQINQGALVNIRYFASVDPKTNGGNGKKNDDPEFTRNKTDIQAAYVKDSEGQWIVYDVFFNNDGKKMVDRSFQQHYYFQGPFNIMDLTSEGGYKPNTVKELSFTRYRNTGGKRLSDGGKGFTQYGNPAIISNPASQQRQIFDNDRDSFYDPNSGVTGRRNQPWEVFKHNQDEEDLNRLTKDKKGNYPRWSYYLGVDVHRESVEYAIHMHVKIKLRDDVTSEEAATYGRVYAASVTKGGTTNQSYIMGATGTRLTTKTDAQLSPIQGSTHNKTVGDTLPNKDNPVADKYITPKNGGEFPGGMSWSWKNNVKPSTDKAGVFKYTVVASYQDGSSSEDKNSGSDGTVTLNVKPKIPEINQSSVNEKAGKVGQTVTVNVGKGVPDNSTVTLYSGNKVIGEGTTSGQKATINVHGVLPSTEIKAKTSVQNSYGKVESEFSAPVTPTEVPDSVAPKVLFNGKELTINADDTRFIVYRGANFNPTFKVQDDKNNVNLSITGLPKGVADVSKNGSKEFDYTIPENTVANDAPFGESTATVTATDGRNSATYKFKYRIVDLQAGNTTPENRAIGSELGDPHSHLKVADSATSDSDNYYPTGMQFKWKELDPRTLRPTDVPNTTKLNEIGNVTKYIPTAVFPGTVNKKTIDGVEYTIYTPTQKAVPKTFNVTDSIAPTVKLTNLIAKNETVLTNTVPTSTDGTDGTAITIFRGAKLVLPFKFSDNATEGRVNVQYVSGLPKGVSFGGANNKLTFTGANETNPATHTVEGKVAADATLGYSTVTLKVSDSKDGDVSKGNSSEVKFRVRVLDLDFEPGRVAEPNQSSTTINATKGQNLEDANNYLTVNSGTNRQDQNNFPGGMTFRMVDSTTNTVISKLPDAPGRHVVKARAYFPVDYAGTNEVSEVVTGNADTQLNGRRYMEKTINFVVKPTAPTIAPANGDVTITPANEVNVNKFEFKYTNANKDNPTVQTVTATKANNRWTLSGQPTDGVTINENTGVVTIKDREVKDATNVTAKAVTTDVTGSIESETNTATTNAGERELPKFTFDETNTAVENGVRTVYVTPTESNNFKLGTFTDNSNKLIEARISEQNNVGNDLAFGLSYSEKFTKTPNTEKEGSRDIIVTGTLDKTNRGARWTNNSSVITRYAVATDAAGNELKDLTDNPANKTRMIFKVLTQAEKYNPTTSKQLLNKDVTAPGATISEAEFNTMKPNLNLNFTANRGEVKVNSTTPDLNVVMKDGGAIKRKSDGTYYVGATITYPDLSTEDIEIPVDKSDKVAPRVSLQVGRDTIPLTTTAENTFVIFRGATFNPSLVVNDNSGTVSYLKVSGLPSGRELIKDTAMTSGTNVTIDGDNAATNNATLGRHEASVLVRDASGNEETYKFAYTVEDAIPKETPKTVPLGTKLGTDSHDYVKLANSTEPDYTVYPNGMSFKWKKGNVEVTDRETALTVPGRITGYKAVVKFPAAGFYTKNGVKIYTPESIERDITFLVKPTAPRIDNQANGDVTITPANETNVNTLNFTYIHPNGSTQTITATKTGSTWSLSNAPADGVTINENTGVVTIKDRAVKDNQTVTAKSVTAETTPADRVESDITNGTSPAGDTERPKFVFNENGKETRVENGDQVVYVTPTETTDIEIGSVTDNSNKLLKVEMSSTISEFGGITFEGVANRTDNVELDAPRKVTVRGVIPGKNGTRNWVGNEVYTRNVRAQDAATLTTEDSAANTVKFKVLIQKDKYTPNTVAPVIERDITQPNTSLTDEEFNKIKDSLTFTADKGTVKIDKNTPNLTFVSDKVIRAKDDGSYYVSATVTYPDGSSETVELPVDAKQANKSKATLTAQEVSIKAAKDKNAQGVVPTTESSRVTNNITIPNNQPQPTTKVLKDNGRITEVDGKKVATVVLTYSDNSTKEVTVPVLEVKPIDITTTFNELDNTVTVKPNTTVETGDKLHVAIRGVGMQLTKTADGYTNSRNDRNITVNQDGSITVTLSGEEKFQAGDRVVTRHESNKNGKVDSYETEAFAGLKPVEKVPVINLTALTNEEKEDVKAAVKKANPSVNTAELEVAANGDVTYRHKGAGVGASDPTPEVRLNGNVIRKVLAATPANPSKKALEGREYTSGDTPVVTTNKPNAVITSTPTNGLSVTPEGKVTGTPSGITWTDDSDEEKVVRIPVVVSHTGDTDVPVTVEVTVQRDTDHDGVADKEDDDDDNDGIPDTKDSTPKTATALTATPANPSKKALEGREYTSGDTPVVTTNKPNAVITSTPTNGLSVTPEGKVTGTPSGITWTDDSDEEKVVRIPVVVSHTGDTDVPVTVEVTVQISSKKGVPEVAEVPEFNGAVNGELPDPVELPKVKVIITKWIDEQGNELKPADAKAPAVVGEANEAFEHGEIEGYVFVKTKVEGDVVTHVFRKVAPTKPEGNGGQQGGDNTPQPTPEVPTDNTERKPETDKPTVPDTKQAEQPTQTVDAQVAPSQNQAVLPNTGTKADRATGALGALSLLGAFGLLFAKKKKDDEEETRNN